MSILISLYKQFLSTLRGHLDAVLDVAFNSDGKYLATASQDTTIKLWNPDGIPLRKLAINSGKIANIKFSHNGGGVASISKNGILHFWKTDGHLVKELIVDKSSRTSSASFNSDCTILASALGTRIKLWNLREHSNQILVGHQAEVNWICFSPNGRLLASCDAGGAIKVWDICGSCLQTWRSYNFCALHSICFHPNNKLLISAGKDKDIHFWNIDGTLLKSITGHTSEIYSVCFHTDGLRFLTASGDKSLNMWSIDGKLLTSMNGHQDAVKFVCFSPDGEIIASGSSDNTVKIWSIRGVELHTFKGHSSEITSMSFSPDGKTLASSDANGTVILWNLNLDVLLTLGRNWIWNYLQGVACRNTLDGENDCHRTGSE